MEADDCPGAATRVRQSIVNGHESILTSAFREAADARPLLTSTALQLQVKDSRWSETAPLRVPPHDVVWFIHARSIARHEQSEVAV